MWDCTRLTALPETWMAQNGFPLIFTSTSGAPTGRSRCTMQPASQVRAGSTGASVGIGSSRGEGAAWPAQWSLDALRRASHLNHPPGKRRRSLPSIPMLGCIRQLYSLHELRGGGWVPHSNRLSVRTGRARRRRSITTPSATWLADGAPSSSQCCTSRVSSAAWARAGRRGLYSHS